MSGMGRRAFITLLGGAAAAGPLVARAQQTDRMRRIGVLMKLAADDPEAPARVAAFAQGLQELGWTMGRNVRIGARRGPSYEPSATRLESLQLHKSFHSGQMSLTNDSSEFGKLKRSRRNSDHRWRGARRDLLGMLRRDHAERL